MDVTQTRPPLGWIEVIAGSMVQRQERGTDSPAPPRADRAAQGADLQAQVDTATATNHIISHSDMRIAPRVSRRHASCSRGAARDGSGRHRRGAVLRPGAPGRLLHAGGFRENGCGRGPRPGLPRQAVDRCRAAGDRRIITKTLAIFMVCGAPRQHHPAPCRQQRCGCWSARMDPTISQDVGGASIDCWAARILPINLVPRRRARRGRVSCR